MTGVDLAVLTTAVCAVAWEAAKGAAGEAGKDLWASLKGLLKVEAGPDAPRQIAERLERDDTVRAEVLRLLSEYQPPQTSIVSTINVRDFTAKNVFNAHTQTFGDVQ